MLQYLKRVGIALSVLFNVLFGGYSNQAFSARNYAWKRENRYNAVWLIDWLAIIIGHGLNFILRENKDYSNHCMEAWCFWRIRKDGGLHQKENS